MNNKTNSRNPEVLFITNGEVDPLQSDKPIGNDDETINRILTIYDTQIKQNCPDFVSASDIKTYLDDLSLIDLTDPSARVRILDIIKKYSNVKLPNIEQCYYYMTRKTRMHNIKNDIITNNQLIANNTTINFGQGDRFNATNSIITNEFNINHNNVSGNGGINSGTIHIG